jgi:hypothetical protein
MDTKSSLMKKWIVFLQKFFIFVHVVKSEGKSSRGYHNVKPVKWNPLTFIFVLCSAIVIGICTGAVAFYETFKSVYID